MPLARNIGAARPNAIGYTMLIASRSFAPPVR